MLSWISGEDYLIYDKPDDQNYIGECIHCKKKYKNIVSLVYQHKKFCTSKAAHHMNQLTIENALDLTRKRNSKNTDKNKEKLRKIAYFLCENGLSINVTQSKSFKALTGYNYTEAEIRKTIIDMADEIKNETTKKFNNKISSIVIDGASIIGQPSWYAIGLATETSLHLYDVYHFSNSTTLVITEQLNKIIEEIEKQCCCLVVGASSDNAKNITNVFSPDHQNGLGKRICTKSGLEKVTSTPHSF